MQQCFTTSNSSFNLNHEIKYDKISDMHNESRKKLYYFLSISLTTYDKQKITVAFYIVVVNRISRKKKPGEASNWLMKK